jgi:hypothetical protein
VRQGSGEEGGGSDEGHKDREGRGKPEGDEDDDLEFGGLMDGQQLMDGQEDEDDEMFDAQHSGTGTIGGAAMYRLIYIYIYIYIYEPPCGARRIAVWVGGPLPSSSFVIGVAVWLCR